MSYRILMVLDHPFPEDARVHNEARSLIDAGFDVSLLALSDDDERPRTEDLDGLTLYRERIPDMLRRVMRGVAGQVPAYTAYLSNRIEHYVKRYGFDAIHVHDLYLVGGGLRASRRLDVPVVADLHENVVHALQVYAWSTRPPGKWVVDIDAWEASEKQWVNEVDRLIVVIEEARDRQMAIGVPEERICVVPNTIAQGLFDAYPVEQDLIDRFKDDLIITYTGGFNLHRGLASVLDAMPEVFAAVDNAKLLLVGRGDIMDELQAQAASLGIADRVIFEGWQPQARLKSYIMASDITLVPHLKSVHTDATIPHKLFHYMYFNKPVVVTDCKPLKRIVEREDAGAVFPSGDSAALARILIDLAGDPDKRQALGERGHDAVLARYTWDATVKDLVKMYSEMAEAPRRPGLEGERLHDNPVEDRRFKNTLRFLDRSVARPRRVLDLGPPNALGTMFDRFGYEVVNTEGDLDDEPSIASTTDVDAACAFEILEHLVGPLEVLRAIKAPRLFASVPLKLWFADAYFNADDPLDCHYHEFEPWQFDRLLEKAGWRIVRRERWKSPTPTRGVRPLLRKVTDRYYAVEAVRADSSDDT